MADLERNIVVWTGLQGLPGVSVFYGAAGGNANASLKTFFTACQSLFPAGLNWAIPGGGDIIDSATGQVGATWSNPGGGGAVAASGAVSHAAGCGAYVNWKTAVVIGRRRLQGRTFMAPLINSAYDGTGTILAGNLATLQTAANNLVIAGNIRIWHRNTSVGSSDGLAGTPTVALVPDQVTSLRTRRR